jgi:hypothetical protein
VQAGYTVRFHLHGVEDVGDGSGACITETAKQYRHFMENFVFANYTTGAWPSVPTFADSTPIVDASSFDGLSSLRGPIPDAWGLRPTSIEERVSAQEFIARANLSNMVKSGFNRKGQFFVVAPPNVYADASPVDTITEALEIFDFQVEDFRPGEELINAIGFTYGEDYATGTFAVDPDSAAFQAYNATSISDEEEYARLVLYFYLLQNASNAATFATAWLNQWIVSRTATATVGLIGLNYELGDVLRVTHSDGPGASGYVNQLLYIKGMEVDLDQSRVRLELEDLFTTG